MFLKTDKHRARGSQVATSMFARWVQGTALLASGILLASGLAVVAGSMPAAAAPPDGVTPPLVTCTTDQTRATQRWWRFGDQAGIDFGTSGTTATAFTAPGNTEEGSTVVTDTAGNLQFWSNGQTVFDANSNPMPNGSGLLGNPSATQTVAAFPLVGEPGKYVVVTTSVDVGDGANGSLSYSIVDMSLNGGLGDVVDGQRNLPLGDSNTASEGLVAVPNADGTGFWVYTYTNNSPNVIGYEFDGDGYTGTAVTSVLSDDNFDGYGSLVLSPDGTTLLQETGEFSHGAPTGAFAATLRILTVDGATGEVYPKFAWDGSTSQGTQGYTADFSPNGDYVYFSRIFNGGELYRYTIAGATSSAEIKASEEDLGSTGPTGGHVARGPDGRLYVANAGEGSLSVVNSPNSADPDYIQGGLPLAAGSVSNFGLPQMVTGCGAPVLLDFGDAPDTYGTTLAADGARHLIPGYDADAHTAPVMLGDHIDAEEDGQPTDAADGDDTNGVNDEDGVTFNADLGYDQPAVLTGFDPNTLQPVENTLTVNASADGFVSAWIDWNENGVFDADEQVAAAQPVTAGDNAVTFSQGDNPPGIYTYARVRYSTDADAIASPTGEAPDGEVEDYQVLVQRLTTPDTCTVNDTPHYAFTFSKPVDLTGDGGVGTSARFENVSVVDGVAIDMVAEVEDGHLAAGDHFSVGNGDIIGTDDIEWNIDKDATIRYSFYEAGTTTPIDINAVFTVNDMDGLGGQFEVATFDAADVADYSVAQGSAVTIVDDGDQVAFHGNGNHDGDPGSRFQFVLEGLNTFETHWQGGANSGFGFDGDGDLSITPPACSDFGDAPDSYGTTLGNDGASHTIVPGLDLGSTIDFDPDGQPNAAADGDDTNRVADEDGVVDPIVVTTGETTSVTVSATNNTADAATLAGWIDLDGNGTFDAGELVSVPVPANSGTADYTLTFPAGTTTDDTYARFRLFAGEAADPAPTGAVDGGEVEDYAVTGQTRELSIDKTSDATADSRVGDTVEYTVTATNIGSGDYTADDPAVVFDDLTGVLDDADFNGDATATLGDDPSYTEPTVSWSGALEAGQSVEITYSVTLKAGGDGDVRNVAWEPNDPNDHTAPVCDPRNADGTDPTTGEPCGTTDFVLPTVTIDKTANTTELPTNGGTVEYTVTVTNNSDGDFTADAPATASDDLSKVLDDGTYNDDADATVGDVTFDQNGQKLDWTGALAAGDSATITYTVTYDSNKAGGDHELVNVACAPADLVQAGDDPCRSVDVPGAALQQRKSVDPASGTAVAAGQDVTYTLTFENTGKTDAAVDTFDDLSNVLDDATLAGDPTPSNPALSATVNGDQLAIAGSVPAGETYTVSYTVTVKAFADQGDHDLANVLGGDDQCAQDDPTCRTDNPIRHVTVTKVAVPADGVNTGDTVDYTVTVTNDGVGDYTDADPAVVNDDLTGVIDDATFDQLSASAPSGDLAYTEPVLSWTGALASGDSVAITYSVTVTNAGDHDLVNTAGAVCTDPEICDPPVTVEEPLPHVVPSKTSEPADGSDVNAGDVVTYTLSWTNDGEAAGPVDSTDDLSNVLDDADISKEPVSSAPDAVTATRTDDSLRVVGDIGPGQTVTVTYQVTVKPNGQHGDNDLGNVLTQDNPQLCDDGNPCPPPTTDHLVGDLDDWKSVDPASGTTVQPGTVMTYTLHFENSGKAPVDVANDDDLSMVLDDADLTADPEASDAALSVSPVTDGRFSITGSLDAGQAATVTYTVTVKADGQRGDDQLGNFLLQPDGTVPPDGECVPVDDQKPDCTVNYVSDVTVAKSSDPATGTEVASGQSVTYTLTFTNVGTNPAAADAPVDEIDYMKDVLDDATLTGGPTPSDAALTATSEGQTIHVTGALATGQIAQVTYTVQVKAYGDQGNHALGNVVARTGDDPICAPDSQLCTMHKVTPPAPGLADTGSDVTTAGLLAALLVSLGGIGLLLGLRRRRRLS